MSIDLEANKQIWDYAYKIGCIQGIINGYRKNIVRSIDAIDRIETICNEPLESEKKPGYCAIGMDRCVECSWQGDYPVSGCPSCNQSFVS